MSGWTPKAMKIPVHPAIYRGETNMIKKCRLALIMIAILIGVVRLNATHQVSATLYDGHHYTNPYSNAKSAQLPMNDPTEQLVATALAADVSLAPIGDNPTFLPLIAKPPEFVGDCPVMNTDSRVPPETALLWLNIHNELRNQYCVPPLQWDANLAKVAQDYADLGAWDLPHNPNRREQYAALIDCDIESEWCPAVGENVHFHSPWDFFPFQGCLDGFISEENPNQCNQGGAHYTTMMAARYTRLGCGGYIDEQNRFHLVCNYAESEPYSSSFPFPAANCSCAPEPFSPVVTSCFE